jgi:Na+/proline symporter
LAKPYASVRAISIVMGIIIGSVLAFALQANLPTMFFEFNVATLIVFVSIPLLIGFLVGILHPPTGGIDGAIVGLLTGLINSVMASVKLIFAPTLAAGEPFAFALYATMSVFIWVFLAAAAGIVGSRLYERPQ